MFDWYEPVPRPACPFCGTVLDEWQGYDGECALFVWRQGEPHPVEQRVDADARLDSAELRRFRLPDTFAMRAYCPHDGRPLDAEGRCRDGVWVETAPTW